MSASLTLPLPVAAAPRTAGRPTARAACGRARGIGGYFAQLAAEQGTEREMEQADECPLAEHPTRVLAGMAAPAPPPEAAQPPSLSGLWQDTLAGLRLRLPRDVYGICVREAMLVSCGDGIVTIGVSDVRFKNTLERGYLAALRFALGDALGREVTVQVTIHNRTVSLLHLLLFPFHPAKLRVVDARFSRAGALGECRAAGRDTDTDRSPRQSARCNYRDGAPSHGPGYL